MQNMSLSGFLNLKHQKLTNGQFWGPEIVILDKGYLKDSRTDGRLLEVKNLRWMKT